jgi:hypothetical protein
MNKRRRIYRAILTAALLTAVGIFWHCSVIDAKQLDGGLSGDKQSGENKPLSCELLKNEPNPFNRETAIIFTVPEKMHVLIEIHNAAGRMVGIAADDFFSPGKHAVEWDARGMNGEELSEGIYFYVMTAGEHKETRKMALIK